MWNRREREPRVIEPGTVSQFLTPQAQSWEEQQQQSHEARVREDRTQISYTARLAAIHYQELCQAELPENVALELTKIWYAATLNSK